MTNFQNSNSFSNFQNDHVIDNNFDQYKILVDPLKNPFSLNHVNEQLKQEENQQNIVLSKKISKNNIPYFFKFEKRFLILKILVVLLLFLGSLGGLLFLLLNNIHFKQYNINNGYYVLDVLFLLPTSIILVISLINFHFLNKEYKNSINNFNNSYISNVIQNIYKKIYVGNINLIWLSLYIIITCLFILLLIFIISYFYGLWNFGGILAPSFGNIDSNKWFIIGYENLNLGIYPNLNKFALIIICSIIGFTVLNQILFFLLNDVRLKRMDSTYQVNILTNEEKVVLKHATNVRNFIIFCVLTIILGLILLVVYLLLKRKK